MTTKKPDIVVPDEINTLFWNSFGEYLNENSQVTAGPLSKDTYLFFADIEPEANWAHRCAYSIIRATGARSFHIAEWPPSPFLLDNMVQVKRPPKVDKKKYKESVDKDKGP
jgi:hypothetical protein